ncbi:hypothetical protein PSPO01_02438 [Paraphaeosphaeria sporulosa]
MVDVTISRICLPVHGLALVFSWSGSKALVEVAVSDAPVKVVICRSAANGSSTWRDERLPRKLTLSGHVPAQNVCVSSVDLCADPGSRRPSNASHRAGTKRDLPAACFAPGQLAEPRTSHRSDGRAAQASKEALRWRAEHGFPMGSHINGPGMAQLLAVTLGHAAAGAHFPDFRCLTYPSIRRTLLSTSALIACIHRFRPAAPCSRLGRWRNRAPDHQAQPAPAHRTAPIDCGRRSAAAPRAFRSSHGKRRFGVSLRAWPPRSAAVWMTNAPTYVIGSFFEQPHLRALTPPPGLRTSTRPVPPPRPFFP